MAEGILIEENDDGQRLDRWLKKKFPTLGFAQVQKILRTGQVRVDGKRVKGDARLAMGQLVRIPPQAQEQAQKKGVSPRTADFIQSLVIYQDEHIIAINKPSGIATQGGSKIAKHIDGMLEGLSRDGIKPHLVHRLDKDTSGVLLLARNARAAREMGHLFKGRDIRKYYWAIVTPVPALREGKIKSALAKVEGRGGERMMVVDEEEGRSALTFYTVMDNAAEAAAWVAFWPRTGRQHQIRVHAASEMGCPIVGDFKYGPEQEFLAEHPELPQSLHLHARRVIFTHPATGKTVDITAPLDKDMQKTFSYFGFNAKDKSDPFEEIE